MTQNVRRARLNALAAANRKDGQTMDQMMNGMGWMMAGGMWLIWLLVVIVLVLGTAALVKFLRSGPK